MGFFTEKEEELTKQEIIYMRLRIAEIIIQNELIESEEELIKKAEFIFDWITKE